jgi:hypothetical protein
MAETQSNPWSKVWRTLGDVARNVGDVALFGRGLQLRIDALEHRVHLLDGRSEPTPEQIKTALDNIAAQADAKTGDKR